MFSYPSSFKSSRVSQKQNNNPNVQVGHMNKKKRSGFRFEGDHLSYDKFFNNIQASNQCLNVKNNDNCQQEDEYTKQQQYQQQKQHLEQFKDNQSQAHMKHLQYAQQLKNSNKQQPSALYSTHQQDQYSKEPESFESLAVYVYRDKMPYISSSPTKTQIISFCRDNNILHMQDLHEIASTSLQFCICECDTKLKETKKINKNLRYVLGTDLGKLIIEQLCQELSNIQNITQLSKQHQQILDILFPSSTTDLTQKLIRQQYEIYMQQIQYQIEEKRKLALLFKQLFKNKIKPKLNNHFKQDITHVLKSLQLKDRIAFQPLKKSLGYIFSQKQLSILFRFVYELQYDGLMPILDASKTIDAKLLYRTLTNSKKQSNVIQNNIQKKSERFVFQQKNSEITNLQNQLKRQNQVIKNKDLEINKLNTTIQFLHKQNEQNQLNLKYLMKIELESMRSMYQKKLKQQKLKNEQHARMASWYQKQLQYMLHQNNKQNIMGRYLS